MPNSITDPPCKAGVINDVMVMAMIYAEASSILYSANEFIIWIRRFSEPPGAPQPVRAFSLVFDSPNSAAQCHFMSGEPLVLQSQ
jgi:hypothetical protein